ncbi:hypothetical protein BT96DRAFT_146022 [Gymnopus androsaceus JB14]|uniref:Uncharacterized protein n=1 Tax=Gymnopus androsaceus JB14 TaxID=1447944 RepID=A0A6A4HCH9_9AGAR|nr:hypothetical protein BT96DRAFT_146022 [Gymnopus androsaceus JB14]
MKESQSSWLFLDCLPRRLMIVPYKEVQMMRLKVKELQAESQRKAAQKASRTALSVLHESPVIPRPWYASRNFAGKVTGFD